MSLGRQSGLVHLPHAHYTFRHMVTQTGLCCALCRAERPLRESHITPKFLWKDSGLTGSYRTFEAYCQTHSKLTQGHRQDGFKECLLCDSCEQRFAVIERYAKEQLFGKSGPLRIRPRDHFVWTGLNYSLLKRFQISILWRMSVSRLPFYAHVTLGDHEDKLRRMLLADDPGLPDQYGCICTLLDFKGQPPSSAFSQPRLHKSMGCYVCVMAGMHWFMFATDKPPSPMFTPLLLSLSGQWVLLNGDITRFGYLNKQLRDLVGRKKMA